MAPLMLISAPLVDCVYIWSICQHPWEDLFLEPPSSLSHSPLAHFRAKYLGAWSLEPGDLGCSASPAS